MLDCCQEVIEVGREDWNVEATISLPVCGIRVQLRRRNPSVPYRRSMKGPSRSNRLAYGRTAALALYLDRICVGIPPCSPEAGDGCHNF